MVDLAVVLGSGPSLGHDNYADVETVRNSGAFVATVNTTWKRAPWADILYAGDNCWWREHGKKVTSGAERWTCSLSSAKKFNCNHRARQIRPGYNSGACAIEVVANVYNASTILMLGFDCSVKHGIHHHGPHKRTGNPDSCRCRQWRRQFKSLKDVCKNTRIINCSRYTELDVFECMPLAQALGLFSTSRQ